jgi:hypothetical protein
MDMIVKQRIAIPIMLRRWIECMKILYLIVISITNLGCLDQTATKSLKMIYRREKVKITRQFYLRVEYPSIEFQQINKKILKKAKL